MRITPRVAHWSKCMLELPRSDNTLHDVLEYYVKTVSPQKRSYESEVYRIRALQDVMGHLRLDEVAPIHVVSFRDRRLATPLRHDPDRMLAGSTVKAELMLLSHVYTMAISEWGMGHLVNPVARIRKSNIRWPIRSFRMATGAICERLQRLKCGSVSVAAGGSSALCKAFHKAEDPPDADNIRQQFGHCCRWTDN